MPRSVQIAGRTVHLIGSIHSSSDCVRLLDSVAPQQLFLEATREAIGLVKRNPAHSQRLKDLPALLAYSDRHNIPVHAVDTPVNTIAGKVLEGYSLRDRLSLWEYVCSRKVISPITNLMFQSIVNRSASFLDAPVTRWSLAPSLLSDARELVSQGGSDEDLVSLIQSRQSVGSFLVVPDYDPLAYVSLCRQLGIDVRLQSVLIDYRNEYMCEQIRRVLRSLPADSVSAVVVGANHVPGMHANLSLGIEYLPASLSLPPPPPSPFIDQLLLAQILNT